MQALRLTRPTHPRLALRRLTTAASSASTSTAASAPLLIPLSNVEAQWEKLSKADQATVQNQLEEIQKKDWKVLSVDEKKAGACLRVALLLERCSLTARRFFFFFSFFSFL